MCKISNYKTIELDNSENMKQGNHFGLLAAQLIRKKKKEEGKFQKILWFIFLIFCYFISLQFKIEGTSRSRECFFEKNRDNFEKGLKFLMNDTPIEILVTKETNIITIPCTVQKKLTLINQALNSLKTGTQVF